MKNGFGIDILQSENSRLSSGLSNKISELQHEREIKHKLITQFEKLQFEQEANQEVVDKLRKINLKNFSKRNTHINGWYFIKEKGWLWIDLDYHPMVYSNAEDAWIHYDQGTSNPWHYYNYSTQEWFEWE